MREYSYANPSLALLVAATSLAGGGAEGPQIPETRLEDLAWLAGAWHGTEGTARSEEHWLPPDGGLMLGLHRTVAAPGKAFFEYLRIEATPEGIDYVASPGGGPPTRFRLVEAGKHRVVFANPAHDFPQRILYWLDDAGALHARIEGKVEGKDHSQAWVWERAE